MEKYVSIIVSRYNENLYWMNEQPFNKFRYIIYNKGINDNFEKKYASKIINYQMLEDVTILIYTIL